jgi:hypothetical protein
MPDMSQNGPADVAEHDMDMTKGCQNGRGVTY